MYDIVTPFYEVCAFNQSDESDVSGKMFTQMDMVADVDMAEPNRVYPSGCILIDPNCFSCTYLKSDSTVLSTYAVVQPRCTIDPYKIYKALVESFRRWFAKYECLIFDIDDLKYWDLIFMVTIHIMNGEPVVEVL